MPTGCYLFRSTIKNISPTVRRRNEHNDMDYESTCVYYHEHFYTDGKYRLLDSFVHGDQTTKSVFMERSSDDSTGN